MKIITNPKDLPKGWLDAFALSLEAAEEADYPDEKKIYLDNVTSGVLFVVHEEEETDAITNLC